jgi:signal transduction histidine kinase
MKHLIDDLLSAYKLDMRLKFTFSETRIVELASQVVTELSSMLNEKAININANILLTENNETVITCHALRLRPVLINLIRNSVDFLPASEGEIIITLEDMHVEQEQPIDSKSAALLISIADNGPGVPPDKVSGLFKKFYQADPKATRKHGGTGVGLAICKEIVEMHGGKIWYKTSYGDGACFKILTPQTSANQLE